MIRIYKITNIINDKIYIGQTIKSLKERFYQHCEKHSCCIKLKNAINKYGKENFIIEQIDHAHTQAEADAKEIFYIEVFNTQNDKLGYNIAGGGYTTNPSIRKKVICLETNQIFNSVSEAAKYFNTSIKNISRVCRGERHRFNDKHFAFLDKDNKPVLDKIDFNAKKSKRKVQCVETGEVFNSIKEASNKFNLSRFAVGYACKNSKNTCAKLHWKYVNF